MDALPNNWSDVQADTIYRSTAGLLVFFADEQINLGSRYDQNGKHLKAIEKGEVSPRGSIGLVPSQEDGYDLKTKVLGKGGNRRFHARFIDDILYFPGLDTEH